MTLVSTGPEELVVLADRLERRALTCYINREFGQANKSITSALSCYARAVSLGHAEALAPYADLLDATEQVEKAFDAYLEGASLGNAYCEASVGHMYQRGEGVVANDHKAYYWISRAVAQRQTAEMLSAYVMMANFHYSSSAVEEDCIESCRWLLIALAVCKKNAKYSDCDYSVIDLRRSRYSLWPGFYYKKKDRPLCLSVSEVARELRDFLRQIASELSSEEIEIAHQRALSWARLHGRDLIDGFL